MWITATGGNVAGLSKEVKQTTLGEGKKDDSADKGEQHSLEDFMKKMFGPTGLQVKLSPEMKKITRGFWSANQSPADWLRKFAKDNGGIMSIENGVASIVGRFEGVNADGDAMPNVDAVWGVNLIGWRIKPYAGRPKYAKAQSRVFDMFKGEWDKIEAAISGDKSFFSGAKAIAHLIQPAADKGTAEQGNKGTTADSQSRRGTGWVLINGEPNAKGGGFVTISDARPGVDGRYLITESEHNYTRGVGYTTRMNVQYPIPNYGKLHSWERGLEPPALPGPLPPELLPPPPGVRAYTREEREAMRESFRRQGQPIPSWMTQSTDPEGEGYVPPPAKPTPPPPTPTEPTAP